MFYDFFGNMVNLDEIACYEINKIGEAYDVLFEGKLNLYEGDITLKNGEHITIRRFKHETEDFNKLIRFKQVLLMSSFELYIEQLKKIKEENPELAKKLAYSSLLEAGIIDETVVLPQKENQPKKLIRKE